MTAADLADVPLKKQVQRAPLSPESITWFEMEQARADARERGEWPEPMSITDVVAHPKPPVWYRREMEYDFRRGFCHGFEHAIEQMQSMTKKGYGRPREIGNIMCRFLLELRRWSKRAFTDPIDQQGFNDGRFPEISQDSWSAMRKMAFARDGHKCMACDRAEDLEAHHIRPVSEGGLPELKNLLTPCVKCHRGTVVSEPPDNLSEREAEALLVPLAQITGIRWGWASGARGNHGIEGEWQLMPERSEDEGEFWWWHLDYRRQWFDNRPEAVNNLLKSFNRWREFKTRGPR